MNAWTSILQSGGETAQSIPWGEYLGVVFALLLLEAVLSFDNAAILAAMVRRLPVRDRKKALFYGLLGAYGMRFAMVAMAAWLIQNEWLKFVGGGYLVYLFAKHFIHIIRHRGDIPEPGETQADPDKQPFLVRLGVPMLVATIIQIELMDLAFALDQVLAAVAFVQGYPFWHAIVLIIIASGIGIAMLRLAAIYIVKVMDWLPLLEHMAYVAVGYVGIKLILTFSGDTIFGMDLAGFNHGHGFHIPNPVSIGVTLALFGIPVLMKLIFKWPKSRVEPSEPPMH